MNVSARFDQPRLRRGLLVAGSALILLHLLAAPWLLVLAPGSLLVAAGVFSARRAGREAFGFAVVAAGKAADLLLVAADEFPFPATADRVVYLPYLALGAAAWTALSFAARPPAAFAEPTLVRGAAVVGFLAATVGLTGGEGAFFNLPSALPEAIAFATLLAAVPRGEPRAPRATALRAGAALAAAAFSSLALFHLFAELASPEKFAWECGGTCPSRTEILVASSLVWGGLVALPAATGLALAVVARRPTARPALYAAAALATLFAILLARLDQNIFDQAFRLPDGLLFYGLAATAGILVPAVAATAVGAFFAARQEGVPAGLAFAAASAGWLVSAVAFRGDDGRFAVAAVALAAGLLILAAAVVPEAALSPRTKPRA